MEDRPFLARSRKPTPASLERALGRAFPAYQALSRLTGSFRSEWTHSRSSGWMQKVHDGRKALCYVVPQEGAFRVSLTVRKKERTTLLRDAPLPALHGALVDAKAYAEGYALRFDVVDEASAAPLVSALERIIALRG